MSGQGGDIDGTSECRDALAGIIRDTHDMVYLNVRDTLVRMNALFNCVSISDKEKWLCDGRNVGDTLLKPSIHKAL